MPKKNEATELNQIKKVAVQGAKNLHKIADITSIPYQRIQYILSHHPIVKDRIMNTLSENRKKKVEFIAEKENEKIDVITVPIEEDDTNISQMPISNRYVIIDASVCGSTGILTAIHNEIFDNGSKIIITDATLTELEKLEDGTDKAGYAARKILVNCAAHPETYSLVKINKTANTDNDIISFASSINSGKVILFTSDKAMSLKARLAKIETSFFSKPSYALRGIFNKNCIQLGRGMNKTVIVMQNGKYLYDGIHQLKGNDTVFIFMKTGNGTEIVLHFDVEKIKNNGEPETIFRKREIVDGNALPEFFKNAYAIYTSLIV